MRKRTTGLLSLSLASAALAMAMAALAVPQYPVKKDRPSPQVRGWTLETTTDATGTPRCTLQSVSAEVTAIMHLLPDGRASFAVKAKREFPSATRLSMEVHDHRHETSDETFSLEDSDGIVEDFLAGGTAYLEWLSPGDQRVIFRHILLLDDFHARLDECEGAEPSQEALRRRDLLDRILSARGVIA